MNQRLPSGPTVMTVRPLAEVGTGNSVIVPLGVIRPIWFPMVSVNQRLPSGPAMMPIGPAVLPSKPLVPVGRGNSLMLPSGVMRPILFPWYSVNQRLSSGPAVMAERVLSAVRTENTVIVPGRDGVVPPPAGWLRTRARAMPLATMTTRLASAMRSHLGADPITCVGADPPERGA